LQIGREEDQPSSLFAFWYIGTRFSTPYHTARVLRMARERLLFGEATRWAYISIVGSPADGGENRIKQFASMLDEAVAIGHEQSLAAGERTEELR
jgi:hypothetical protein